MSSSTEPSLERRSIDLWVAGVTSMVVLATILWAILAPGSLSTVANGALDWMVQNLGWFLVITTGAFAVFVIVVALSRFGSIPLGPDGVRPEFRTVSWIAMMFSAGMGIGLMFYGVNEPLTHFVKPPPGVTPGMTSALSTSVFHWGIHAWAIYAVAGLVIAYGSYRCNRPHLISSAFIPLIGEKRANGPVGKIIDGLALFATLFGSATSLGLGALQIGAGFDDLSWITNPDTAWLAIIIAVLTLAFVASAITGISKGIQYLSNTNMVLAAVLAVFVFILGPTVLILNLIPTVLADYFQQLPTMAGRTGASNGDAVNDWLRSWTVFYWAWWLSWTPFVGMLIARISKGRTIRQFVAGVVGVPTAVSLVWFCTFGGAAIGAQQGGVDLASQGTPEAQLFDLLRTMPIAEVTSVLVMILVAIFFVSGADAASVVLGTLSQRGDTEPKRWLVAFWGVLMGAVAIAMLLVGGEDALNGVQTLTTVVAAPFILLMIGLCVSLLRDMRLDPLVAPRVEPPKHAQEEDNAPQS